MATNGPDSSSPKGKFSPEQGTKSPKSKERASGMNPKIMKVLQAVRAGTMAVTLAAQQLSLMGCGARTGLPEDDTTIVEDQDDGGTVNPDGGGCMGVDAGGCMGVDAGGCMGEEG